RAQFTGRDLPRESNYGSTVEVGIGQAVHEVPRARSGRRNADPKLSRKLCMVRSHECGGRLVRSADEPDAPFALLRQGVEQRKYRIARNAVDRVHAAYTQEL